MQLGGRAGRVCVLTSVHPVEDIRIFHKEAQALARAGYSVSLIAPHDRDEERQGIRVLCVPKSSHRLTRVLFGSNRILLRALQENADLYHFHDPELIPFCFLLKLCGKRVIYDVHEDLPQQVMSKDWIPGWMRKMVSKGCLLIEELAASLFDGCVPATPSISMRFPGGKTVVVQNFPILEQFSEQRVKPYRERPAAAIYVGGISELRGAKDMVRAMALLPQSLGARLILVGSPSPPELVRELREVHGWSRVDFLGLRRVEEVIPLMSRARVGLVALHATPNHLKAYPVKLFEYMAARLPVVASDFPLWRRIVGDAGCGLLVNPTDARAIAGAVQWLLEHPDEAGSMGERGYKAVGERYNWASEEKKLLNLYENILAH